ncbi:acetyltransferase, GNAT family [Gottschalkia acidurici 9a]|uniref:Acetyltransferase, GNAT family n=1 Tax=Gottschalkia acidurici (strain ATCC 7906 / DSM 604 / BCRC 14475 / CIP 104303 / KCTC 5404 / NCIMB 10678 / 9a) TaxID=1128398 RepID=K0AXS3_GOTA9|nr:GNAT family N-acetyltransferase [Gottschalkia acidurici]AFS77540.1 acetyltransferase, GNAT family [Gottschalkia acidurici 9a]
MQTISYKELKISEINLQLFADFNRYQDVKKCWRKENNEWILKDISFTEQWDLPEYDHLIKCLHSTIKTGGVVFGAFYADILVGFASIENQLFGSKSKYLQLSNIYTSYGKRCIGIGKELFLLVCEKAKQMGAEKLYISAHSSEESRAFYKAIGCNEATEYNLKLVAEEPCDCQLEYAL